MALEIYDGPTVIDTTGLSEGTSYDGRKVGYKCSETGDAVEGYHPQYYEDATWSVKHQAFVLPEGKAGGRNEQEKQRTNSKGTNVYPSRD